VRRWGIGRGDWVLEPGCGSGRLTAVLAELTGPAGHVLAFDASAEFIRAGTRRELPEHVSLHAFRMETAPLPLSSFDHAVCFNVFAHLLPHERTARRLAAALRPGGVLWIAHTCSRSRVNAIHSRGPASLRKHILPAPRALERLLYRAGFDDIEIEDGADHFLARAVRPAPGRACDPIGRHA